MDLKFFQLLEFLTVRVSNIEKNLNRIEEKLDFAVALQRNHLIRLKNGDPLDDQMILYGRPYNDLTPQRAWSVYNNPDLDFIFLDVSAEEYKPSVSISGVTKIPLKQLDKRYAELPSKTIPVMIISEDGLNSILACELLVKKGYFNVNNISGGYQFWPGASAENQLGGFDKIA
jgi:rhodanese-related sulfurtransferase